MMRERSSRCSLPMRELDLLRNCSLDTPKENQMHLTGMGATDSGR